MSGILTLRNRHPARRVDLRLLRRIARALLRETQSLETFELGIHLVAEPEMTRLNETFLRHRGSTDVITFDYTGHPGQATRPAEIFVCLDEAVSQARRFHTTWQSELVRYVVHGLLHLLGFDDQHASARRKMRATEDALVARLARQFSFRALSPSGPNRGPSRA